MLEGFIGFLEFREFLWVLGFLFSFRELPSLLGCLPGHSGPSGGYSWLYLSSLADARVVENLFRMLEKYKMHSAQFNSILVRL